MPCADNGACAPAGKDRLKPELQQGARRKSVVSAGVHQCGRQHLLATHPDRERGGRRAVPVAFFCPSR